MPVDDYLSWFLLYNNVPVLAVKFVPASMDTIVSVHMYLPSVPGYIKKVCRHPSTVNRCMGTRILVRYYRWKTPNGCPF